MAKHGIAFLAFLAIEMVALITGYRISPWVALACQIPAGIAFLLMIGLED